MNQNESLDKSIQNLENLVENLREETLEVKTNLNNLKSVIEDLSRQLPLTMNPKGQVNDQSKVNPWTRDGQSDVMKALASLRQRPSVEFSKETFGPTIKALKSKEEGMTASQVGEITGRKRNTESFYLKRLYLAGITKRWIHGREVLYALSSDREIVKKYSDLLM